MRGEGAVGALGMGLRRALPSKNWATRWLRRLQAYYHARGFMTIALLSLINIVWRLWFKPIADEREDLIWRYLLYKGEFSA